MFPSFTSDESVLHVTRHLDLIHNPTNYNQNIAKHARVMACTSNTLENSIRGNNYEKKVNQELTFLQDTYLLDLIHIILNIIKTFPKYGVQKQYLKILIKRK